MTEVTANKERLSKLIKAKNDAAKEQSSLRKQIVDMLPAAVAAAFEQCPNITNIHWKQYCPYFSDGDRCTFSVHDKCIMIDSAMVVKASMKPARLIKWDGSGYSDKELIEGRYEEGWSFSDLLETSEIYAAVSPIFEILDSLDDNEYEEIWGDGVEVTLNENGISVSEYEHD